MVKGCPAAITERGFIEVVEDVIDECGGRNIC